MPAPKAQENNLFLRGDGTWAEPTINTFILTVVNDERKDHMELIAEETDNIGASDGDIVIIKD